MNKGAIKTFAIWARNKLMSDVANNAYLIGITKDGIKDPLPQSTQDMQYFDVGSGTPYALPKAGIILRQKLLSALIADAKASDYATAYRNLLEHTASTWFNRLCAIRFMEVNDYFDDGLRVLSSIEGGKKDSDLMSSPFDSNLEFTEEERKQIVDWRLNNENEALFGFLLLKKCAQLAEFLPGLFSNKEEPSSLLVQFSITDAEGVVQHLVNDVVEDDWKEQVQIIGWLYQFYNTEFKDETNALLKKRGQVLTKERIPSVTQLFTPEWIVKYMVENSLGRIWIEGHLDSKEEFLPTEKEQAVYAAGERDAEDYKWHYYLEEADQEPAVEAELSEIRKEYARLVPEDLSFIDPCMGSGHILCYAFDVLMQIYDSMGYTSRDAVRFILENNIYGLDIDERAYQLAYFSIMMKARQYDHGAFRRGYAPRLYAFEESNGITEQQMEIFGVELSDIERNLAVEQMKSLIKTFQDAKEYGSMLKVDSMDWDLLRKFIASVDAYGRLDLMTMDLSDLTEKLKVIINIGELLTQKYWVTCTNPPYMSPTAKQKALIENEYREGKADLYAVFIIRLDRMTIRNGIQAMITMHSWMFLSSYKDMRKKIIDKNIVNMAHLGTRAFEEIGGEVVQTTTWVSKRVHISGYQSLFKHLLDYSGQDEKEQEFLSGKNEFCCDMNSFKIVPESPLVYWLSDNQIKAFQNESIESVADPRRTLQTGDSNRFIRGWFEVSLEKTDFNYFPREEMLSSNKKWFMFSYGGQRRRWYGNLSLVVNWENNGAEIKASGKAIIPSEQQYFIDNIGWSKVTSGDLSIRYYPQGIIPGDATACLFNCRVDMRLLEAYLNSNVAMCFLKVLSPTLNYATGTVAKVPFSKQKTIQECSTITSLTDECNRLSKDEWDSFELSWEFGRHPLINDVQNGGASFRNGKNSLSECYTIWKRSCEERFKQLKANEEELNRIFIDIYGLQEELNPYIADEEVTLRKADLKRDVKSLISYAVGCMLGRYSLDVEGLAFAGGDWDETFRNNYKTFIPDDDNCIPITDEDYFPDDIVGRFVEFIRVVYGEKSLESNLQFIADAIGGKGGDSREVIRKYFLNDFFKDHCKTYSVTGSGKRPIYWLFDSGKQNGFKALVYMHRWNSDTIATVRARYVSRVQEKYENELRAIDLQTEHLSDPRQKASLQKRKEKILKQVDEIKQYDELIGHLALDHIDIDLDDGVKVNHEKVQHDRNGEKYAILAPIK